MEKEKFIPKYDRIYTNKGGGQYRRADPMTAFEKHGDLWEMDGPDGYWMENVNSSWVCYCVGIVQYKDGTIEWDFSKKGFFKN